MRELSVPPDAENASQAIEVARGWIIDSAFQCSLDPLVRKDTPEVWGVLLADFVAHVSTAIAMESEMSKSQVHRIIAKQLIDEITTPTTEHPGEFIDPDN